MDILLNIVIGVVGIAIGFAIAKQLERKRASQTIKNAKKTAANILKEAKSEGESIKIGLSRINWMIENMEALKEEDIPKDEHEWINTELQELGLTMLNDLYNIKKTLED